MVWNNEFAKGQWLVSKCTTGTWTPLPLKPYSISPGIAEIYNVTFSFKKRVWFYNSHNNPNSAQRLQQSLQNVHHKWIHPCLCGLCLKHNLQRAPVTIIILLSFNTAEIKEKNIAKMCLR